MGKTQPHAFINYTIGFHISINLLIYFCFGGPVASIHAYQLIGTSWVKILVGQNEWDFFLAKNINMIQQCEIVEILKSSQYWSY